MSAAPRRALAAAALVLGAGTVHAQSDAAPPAAPASAPQTLPAVRIEAQRDNPTEQRRHASAAKIVIGRDEIEQHGDATLGEVLRRLPGITLGGRPGRGGALRMRGMGGGYTQILVDGERAPPGFAVDQLSPDLVERIEILRAPTAETGTRAIAGTINIILREPLQARRDDWRASLADERGRVSAHAGWTRNGRFGGDGAEDDGGGTYTLTLGASDRRDRTDTVTRTTHTTPGTGEVLLDQEDTEASVSARRNLNLSARLNWRLGPGERLSLQPFVLAGRSRSRSEATLAAVGDAPDAPYATRLTSGGADYEIARLRMQWQTRLGRDTRGELNGHLGGYRSASDSLQRQFATDGMPVLVQASDTAIRDRSWSLTGKLMHSLVAGHSLVGGWELAAVRRTENATTRVAVAALPGDFGADVQARTRRDALYLQDEWDPAPDWSAYAGVRAETIRTRSAGAAEAVENRSRVVSPLAHLVWRYAAPQRDQLRLSLTQSYRPPGTASLIGVPALNTLYPAPGGNVASAPDRAGNPPLRPEVANGIDLAWERYLHAGGVVAVNLFHRRIRDLIRNVTELEDVPWADEPRWVSRPRNLGKARTSGIELDAKIRLDEWRAGLPPTQLRLNLALYRSQVDGVPGPDNRIDQQPAASGNLGADHRFAGTPWSMGATLALTPAYRTQLTELQSQRTGRRRVLDAYLLYQFGPGTRLRLSLANLEPRDSVSESIVLQDDQRQWVHRTGRTDLATRLQLELRV